MAGDASVARRADCGQAAGELINATWPAQAQRNEERLPWTR